MAFKFVPIRLDSLACLKNAYGDEDFLLLEKLVFLKVDFSEAYNI